MGPELPYIIEVVHLWLVYRAHKTGCISFTGHIHLSLPSLYFMNIFLSFFATTFKYLWSHVYFFSSYLKLISRSAMQSKCIGCYLPFVITKFTSNSFNFMNHISCSVQKKNLLVIIYFLCCSAHERTDK
jgi:hypothetical protein